MDPGLVPVLVGQPETGATHSANVGIRTARRKTGHEFPCFHRKRLDPNQTSAHVLGPRADCAKVLEF
jgi:hypothetical protein